MNERKIGLLMGMEIILRKPLGSEWMDDERTKIAMDRAENFIKELFEKEFRMPSEEELRAELLLTNKYEKPGRKLL